MSNSSFQGSSERYVEKHADTSSRISVVTRPAHILPQPSVCQSHVDILKSYQQKIPVGRQLIPAISQIPTSHSSTSAILTSGAVASGAESSHTQTTSTTTLSTSHPSSLPVHHPTSFSQPNVLQLGIPSAATGQPLACPQMPLNVNSPAFRGSMQPSPAHYTTGFPPHLPRGAVAASALSNPKPGSSMAAAAAVLRPNQPATIQLPPTHSPGVQPLHPQIQPRSSLISVIRPGTPPVTGCSSPAVNPPAHHSDPHRASISLHGAAPPPPSIQITLQPQRTPVEVVAKPVTSHCQPKAVHVPTSKVIVSQGSLAPVVQHPIAMTKSGPGKWNYGTHFVDLTMDAAKPALADVSKDVMLYTSRERSVAIAVPTQTSNSSMSSVSVSTTSNTTLTTATSSAPSAIPVAKVTPQRQQQAAHIPQPSTHAISQESRTESGSSHGQAGNYFIPQPPRVSPSTTALTTSIAGPTTVTHSENRLEGRPAVPHMQPYIQSELIYNAIPYPLVYPTAPALGSVRSGLIPSQPSNYAATNCMSIAPAPPNALRLNPMMVAMDALRAPFSVPPQYSAANTPTTSVTTVVTSLPETVNTGTSNNSAEITPASSSTSIFSNSPASAVVQQAPSGHASMTVVNNTNSSLRPSILRKRTNEGSLVVKKPFGLPSSSSSTETQSPRQESTPQSNASSPKTPAGDNSQSSTDTALSTEAGGPTVITSLGEIRIKQEPPDTHDQNGFAPPSQSNIPLITSHIIPNSIEASPRKKPRKQMLNANEELKDNTSTDEELDKIVELKEFKAKNSKHELKDEYIDEDGIRWTVEKKRPNLSLINFYTMSWKPRNNHFQRYADIKPKEERRPTVNELSNQRGVVQKVSGWKLYFMATQLEDLNDMEKNMYSQISQLQSSLAPKPPSKHSTMEDDASVIHELTQANIQRCKLVMDQLGEAKSSMLKILDHKQRILEIINKHISKRPIKKKERT